MKQFIILLAIFFFNGNSMYSMEKPPKKGLFTRGAERAKQLFSSSPLTLQKANKELLKLLNSKKDLTLEKLQLLLAAGADINIINRDGKTALTKALEESASTSLIEFLVNNKAYIQDSIFLIHAAADNNLKKVQLLLKAGANVDKQDKGGITALWWAVYHINYDMVKALVEAGADVNITTVGGGKPLLNTIDSISKNPEMVKKIMNLLLSHGAVIDEEVLNKAKKVGGEKLLSVISRVPEKLKKKLE
ncbi:MAG: hypothetical protein AMXMBFR12_05880 [Candidatus Babeliales bacterium]